ncbi:MAG: Signal peptidase I S [Firmicutes bacterium ADurb.BinA205]|nr:MAG: Signal peptidase I S [Firmicutes bacterium ADurb.BinA205]
MMKKKKSIEELKAAGLPTTEQLQHEYKRISSRRRFLKAMWSTVSSLIVVAAIAIIISTMLVPIMRTTGGSMSPTLQNDDIILCVKSSDFQNGDIVAFYYNNKVLLKRVIGTPGQTIEIAEDGTVSVDGVVLNEPYVQELAKGECDMTFPYQVPEGRLFVMGDNRSISIDSRSTTIGAVSEELIVGKVKMIIYPFDRMGGV